MRVAKRNLRVLDIRVRREVAFADARADDCPSRTSRRLRRRPARTGVARDTLRTVHGATTEQCRTTRMTREGVATPSRDSHSNARGRKNSIAGRTRTAIPAATPAAADHRLRSGTAVRAAARSSATSSISTRRERDGAVQRLAQNVHAGSRQAADRRRDGRGGDPGASDRPVRMASSADEPDARAAPTIACAILTRDRRVASSVSRPHRWRRGTPDTPARARTAARSPVSCPQVVDEAAAGGRCLRAAPGIRARRASAACPPSRKHRRRAARNANAATSRIRRRATAGSSGMRAAIDALRSAARRSVPRRGRRGTR